MSVARRLARVLGVAGVLVAVVLVYGGEAHGAPQLDPGAYSWNQVFGEPEGLLIYDPPLFACPLRDNKLWSTIYYPYGQPNASLENPHRGIDLPVNRQGIPIYAVTSGTINAVEPDGTGYYTVTQTVSSDSRLKVVYRHVTPVPELVVGLPVTSATMIGEVGLDAGKAKLHFCPTASMSWGTTGYLRPYQFYEGVGGWNSGRDTSFIKRVVRDGNHRKLSATVYSLTSKGARVAPTEVMIFHQREGESVWHATSMTVGADFSYSFDFLTNGYVADGGNVCAWIRAERDFGSELPPSSGYVWEVSPARYERPYEDPNDWPPDKGQSVWFMTLPDLDLTIPRPDPNDQEYVCGLWPVKAQPINCSPYYVAKTTDTEPESRDYYPPFQWCWVTHSWPEPTTLDARSVITVSAHDYDYICLGTETTLVRVDNVLDGDGPGINDGPPTVTPATDPAKFCWEPATPSDPDQHFDSPCVELGYPNVNSKCCQPRTTGSNPHCGLDLDALEGSALHAPFNGFYLGSQYSGTAGLWLLLRLDLNLDQVGDENTFCIFEHLSDVNPSLTPGQYVFRGERIASSGWSGMSNPSLAHIHYQIVTLLPTTNPQDYLEGGPSSCNAITNLMYPYYRHLPPTDWNGGKDVDLVCDVEWQDPENPRVLSAYVYAHEEDWYGVAGTEELTPTTFDSERVRVFYKVLEGYTWSGWQEPLAMAKDPANPLRWTLTWPESLHGKRVRFLIRARRSNEGGGVVSDTYYNFAFYPALQYRPEPWPMLTSVVPGYEDYPYGWIEYLIP